MCDYITNRMAMNENKNDELTIIICETKINDFGKHTLTHYRYILALVRHVTTKIIFFW